MSESRLHESRIQLDLDVERYAAEQPSAPDRYRPRAAMLRNVLKHPLAAQHHFRVLDALAVERFGDIRAHDQESWALRVLEARRDHTALAQAVVRECDAAILDPLLRWSLSRDLYVSGVPNIIEFSILHLRWETGVTVSQALLDSLGGGGNSFLTRALTIVGNHLFGTYPDSDASTALLPSSDAGGSDGSLAEELRWFLVTHPDTPWEVLRHFSPYSDPQWAVSLNHRNFPVSELKRVLVDGLRTMSKGGMDVFGISAALRHDYWTRDENLMHMYEELPPDLRVHFVSKIITHPNCPYAILLPVWRTLPEEALTRFASITDEASILQELAFHSSPAVRNAVMHNAASPDSAASAAALANLGIRD